MLYCQGQAHRAGGCSGGRAHGCRQLPTVNDFQHEVLMQRMLGHNTSLLKLMPKYLAWGKNALANCLRIFCELLLCCTVDACCSPWRCTRTGNGSNLITPHVRGHYNIQAMQSPMGGLAPAQIIFMSANKDGATSFLSGVAQHHGRRSLRKCIDC